MRTMKPLMTILGAAALLAAAVVPAMAQDGEASAAQAQGTLQYTPLITCDFGQGSGLDMAPCAADDAGMHFDYHASFKTSGALDGIGSVAGVLIVAEDGTLHADSTARFVGEVDGCGFGTVDLLLADHEGFYDEDGNPVWTAGSWEVVPGGTLAVNGSFETHGTETPLEPFPTGGIDYAGELSCADAAG